MKIRQEAFRCDLCGEFRSLGVTELQPKIETTICASCVRRAASMLDLHRKTSDEKTP